jgi:hypothetical protein
MVSGTDSKINMSGLQESDTTGNTIQPDVVDDPKTLQCCFCIPIKLAIKIVCVYEMYHCFTEYQLINFGFAFYEVERISKEFLICY